MELNRVALLVIDMQEDYIGEKSRYGHTKLLIDRINKRIETAKENNEIIIYIKNKRALRSGAYTSELVKGLTIESQYVLEKEKASAFANNELLNLLHTYEITQIEMTGIDGNCCIASSAIEATKLGFSVLFPLKYIGVKNTRLFEKTKERLVKANVQIIVDNEDQHTQTPISVSQV